MFIHCGLDLEILGIENLSVQQQSAFVEYAVSNQNECFPPLLKRYLSTKLVAASKIRHEEISSSTSSPSHVVLNCGKDKIQFKQLLRGRAEEDQKEAAELLAVGGFRNTHLSVRKLPQVAEFGKMLGDKTQRTSRSESSLDPTYLSPNWTGSVQVSI